MYQYSYKGHVFIGFSLKKVYTENSSNFKITILFYYSNRVTTVWSD